jgi:hypothetical protein
LAPMEWLDQHGTLIDKVVPGWLDDTRPAAYGLVPGVVAYLHHRALMEDLKFTSRVFAADPLVVHALGAIRQKCRFSDWLFATDFQVMTPSEIDPVTFPLKYLAWGKALPFFHQWGDYLKPDSVLVYSGKVTAGQLDARTIEWHA